MKVILFFILCYKISPIIFTITIIFCRHVAKVTSRYKISPIIFTITIIFCRHVTNVTNFTSLYKISPIIFIITIIFCQHVTNVSNVTSHYKIFPILGYRAPLGAIMFLSFFQAKKSIPCYSIESKELGTSSS